MKGIRLYWQRTTKVPYTANTMPRDRFFKLRYYIKVVDNKAVSEEEKNADRLYKVRPFVEKIHTACLSLPRESNVCIDEQIVAMQTKGHIFNFSDFEILALLKLNWP